MNQLASLNQGDFRAGEIKQPVNDVVNLALRLGDALRQRRHPLA